MREQIDEQNLEQVVGGEVIINGNRMNVAFSTLKKAFRLKNCTYTDAMYVAMSLYEQNKDLSPQEYDTLVMNTFSDKGWI